MGLISMKEITKKQNLKTDKSKQERKRTGGKGGAHAEQNKDLWDNIKRSNIQVIGVLQRNQRWGQKEQQNRRNTQILPNLMIYVYIFIQEAP